MNQNNQQENQNPNSNNSAASNTPPNATPTSASPSDHSSASANPAATGQLNSGPTAMDQTAIIPGMPPGHSNGQFAGLGAVAQGQPAPAHPTTAGATGPTSDQSAGTSEDYAPAVTWRSKYDKEHKRVKVLAGTTAAASLIAIALGVWGVSNASGPPGPAMAAGQLGGPDNMGGGQGGGMGGPGGFGGQGGPSQFLSNLFNSDGSVNTERLNEFKSRAPQGVDMTQMIDRTQEAGAITEEQATKLKAALSSSTGTGSNSSFDLDDYVDDTGTDTGTSSEQETA